MRNAGLEEAQAGVKIAGRNISNLRYADDTTLMAESEEDHNALTPWYFWSKLNKDKNPSSPQEDGAGMKIREYEYDPQTPASSVNIPPLHLNVHHNLLAKETQGRSSSPVCLPCLWEDILA